MKTLFIPAYSKSSIDKSKILQLSKELPKNLVIAYSVQYESQAKQIKSLLQPTHNITQFTQILGCSQPKIKANAILLVGDGRFHAISLAHETNLPIYIHTNNKIEKITEKEINEFEKKQKSSYVKFLNAKRVGILVSTKPGQQNLKKAIDIKNKLTKKESYLFICNNLNTAEFENFPEIQSWINTACRRMDMNDSRIINIEKIKL